MNKLVIFDLDGVLIESRELHFESLNSALAEQGSNFVISREERLGKFDGLNTTKKLQLLTEIKGLPTTLYNVIWQRKQDLTFELLKKFQINQKLIDICKRLKSLDYKIAVASNSIRESVKLS